MPGGREVTEEIEDAVQANKVIALLIAVLALFLALASAGGKWAQTAAISENVEAADLWTFYQAKAIRASTLLTAAERLESETVAESNPAAKATKEQQSNSWKQTAARYESEPETQEGRKELAERAKFAEERRNTSLAKYHNFEIASAALEIGIVLASATIITGITVLAWIAGTLDVVGLAFMGIALIAPHTVHVL